jgi:RNA polymerase sigma-70 factor (ECF subfamily)
MNEFDKEWARVRPSVLRYAVKCTGNMDDAEDLLQETMRKVWQWRHTYDGRARFKTWVLSICRNAWRDEVKKRNVRRPVHAMSFDGNPDITNALEYIADPAPSVLEFLSDESAASDIVREFGDIANFETVALLAQDAEYHEIAEATGVKIGTVKSRINRFRRAACQRATA